MRTSMCTPPTHTHTLPPPVTRWPRWETLAPGGSAPPSTGPRLFPRQTQVRGHERRRALFLPRRGRFQMGLLGLHVVELCVTRNLDSRAPSLGEKQTSQQAWGGGCHRGASPCTDTCHTPREPRAAAEQKLERAGPQQSLAPATALRWDSPPAPSPPRSSQP